MCLMAATPAGSRELRAAKPRCCAKSRVSLALIAVLAIPSVVQPQQQWTDTTGVSFALSGGISNGSYQAGVMSAVLAYMRSSNSRRADFPQSSTWFELEATAGASAGAINSVLLPLTWCANVRIPLSQSLMWRSWVPVGLSQLLGAGAESTGVFSRKYFRESQLPPLKEQLRNAKCDRDVFIGVNLTRSVPKYASIGATEFRVPTQRAVVAYSLGRSGLVPFVNDGFSDGRNGEVISLDGDPTETILKAIVASSAFPVAFAPTELPVSEQAGVKRADFLDGGVFENTPLPTLRRYYSSLKPRAATRRTVTVYVSPDIRTSPLPPTEGDSTDSPIRELLDRFTTLVPTGRSYELAFLLRTPEDYKWLSESVHPSTRSEPTFGPTLGGFGAFLSRSFREHDFIAGVADGLRYSVRQFHCSRSLEGRRDGCSTMREQVDSVAAQLVRHISEIADDSLLSHHVLARLGLPITDDRRSRFTLRDSLLALYAANSAVLDREYDDGDKRRGEACEDPYNARALCASGLGPMLRLVRQTFGGELEPTSRACVWDAGNAQWSSRWECSHDGFIEASPVKAGKSLGVQSENAERRTSTNKYLNFSSLVQDPSEALDQLLSEVFRRLLSSATEEQQRAARGAWWLARTTVLPPSSLALANHTHRPGGIKWPLLHLVPYRISVLAPFTAAAGSSITRVAWITSSTETGRFGVTAEGGAELGQFQRAGSNVSSYSAMVSLAGHLRLPAMKLEAGMVARCRTLRCRELKAQPTSGLPLFLKAGVMDAVFIGAEWGQGVVGSPNGSGLRLSFGVSDTVGLLWLLL